jgi:hypothetical protein
MRGIDNANSMLDTIAHEIEFTDGRSDEYTDNVIAEHIYSQCDTYDRQYNLMEGIIEQNTYGHDFDHADVYIKHGINKQVRKKTKGWQFCVEWKDGTTRWELLDDLKESKPVEAAEYAVSKNLLDTPD